MVFRVYRDTELFGKITISDVDDHVSGAAIVSKKYPDKNFAIGDIVVLSD